MALEVETLREASKTDEIVRFGKRKRNGFAATIVAVRSIVVNER